MDSRILPPVILVHTRNYKDRTTVSPARPASTALKARLQQMARPVWLATTVRSAPRISPIFVQPGTSVELGSVHPLHALLATTAPMKVLALLRDSAMLGTSVT